MGIEPIQPYGTKDLARFKALKGCLFKSKLRKDFDEPSQIGLDYFGLKILLIHFQNYQTAKINKSKINLHIEGWWFKRNPK